MGNKDTRTPLKGVLEDLPNVSRVQLCGTVTVRGTHKNIGSSEQARDVGVQRGMGRAWELETRDAR